jgi:hypothetical protein
MSNLKQFVRLVVLSSFAFGSVTSISLVASQNRTMAITSSDYSNDINKLSTQSSPTVTLPEGALAQKNIDFSLLIGEWSKQGKCNTTRYIFTQDERYQLIEKSQGKWKTLFNGIYVIKSPNIVAVGETRDTGEYSVEISKLTRTSLTAIWNDYEEIISVSWIRCPNR